MTALAAALVIGGCVPPAPTETSAPEATAPPLLATATLIPGRPGESEIFCPTPRTWITYRVQPGDTLLALAEQTSSTVDELAAGNCLLNPRALIVGEVINLPQTPRR